LKLILIRHGRPEHHHYYFSSLSQHEQLVAQYDAAGLSEVGAEAVGKLARQLPGAMILGSDLPRARETAEILRNLSELPIHFDPLFREVKSSNIAVGFLGKLWGPSTMWSLLRSFCWLVGIGDYSESFRQAWTRTGEAVHVILKYMEVEETLILVSHGWFITLIAVYLRRQGLIEKGPLLPNVGFGSTTEYYLRTG
jgi:broad specificity phosphatase PhoE